MTLKQEDEVTGMFGYLTSVDWRYQVWKAGVTFTDNSFLYNLWYLSFSLLGNLNSFFFFIIVILLAIIQGLIIDAFGELRDQLESVKENMESNCFICGMPSDYFD